MLEIELDLRAHCIETAVKRLHNRLVSEYFRSKGSNSESEIKLALLQKIMACLDFSCLRAAQKILEGKNEARVILKDVDSRLPVIMIDGHPIDLKPCIKKKCIGNISKRLNAVNDFMDTPLAS